jgi:hypothetical protein
VNDTWLFAGQQWADAARTLLDDLSLKGGVTGPALAALTRLTQARCNVFMLFLVRLCYSSCAKQQSMSSHKLILLSQSWMEWCTAHTCHVMALTAILRLHEDCTKVHLIGLMRRTRRKGVARGACMCLAPTRMPNGKAAAWRASWWRKGSM